LEDQCDFQAALVVHRI